MSPEPGNPHEADPEQLELIDLPHLPRSRRTSSKDSPGGPRDGTGHDHTPAYLAGESPVARVLLESHVPHLDRLFDYGVPRDLAEEAQPGTRVRVRFGGQRLQGWLIERTADTEVPRDRLQPLIRVQSGLAVLTPGTLAVARLVAARSAGVVADVLRAAVPPRVASVEKQALKARAAEDKDAGKDAVKDPSEDAAQDLTGDPEKAPAEPLPSGQPGPATPAPVDTRAWERYDNGPEAIGALAAGEPVRAVLQALPSHAEHDRLDLVAVAVAVTHASGRGAVVVVPDGKMLDRLQERVERLLPDGVVARLHSDDKPTPRYRAFVQVLEGRRTVALGTRPAVWAPVRDPGLIVVLDDGDGNLVEQRAPYHHARDVALLRAEHEHLAVLIAGQTVTPEAQRLVDTGWARPVRPPRDLLRASMPRIVATSDSWHQQRDSLAGRARLPETAFRVARDALRIGPVLIQVARAGYAPAIACERCRTPARCTACEGPLTVLAHGRQPSCGWCGREAMAWSCPVCHHPRWRMSAVGSQRTAEELGRAFPQVPVIASSGDTIRRSVKGEPALVVATPGAEPWAEGRYAAALLLDGDRMLSRPGLRAEEETLRRWFDAASLVRAGHDGGTVVVTSEHERAVNTLVRWDPAGHARNELAERRVLQLPPAVRSAALTGELGALHDFLDLAQLPPDVRVIGPAPVEDSDLPGPRGRAGRTETGEQLGDDGMTPGGPGSRAEHRVLLFFGYAMAAEVTARLRSARAEASALRRFGVVQVRCDIADLL